MTGSNVSETVARSKERELTGEEIVNLILKPGREFGAYHIQYGGGEFLLRNDALDLIKQSLEIGYEPRVLTNGILITEDMIAELRRISGGNLVLVFGINSIADGKTNYGTRNADLDVTLKALELCKKYRIKRHVVVNVGKFNRHDLETTFQWLEANKISFNRSPFSARMSGKKEFGRMAFARHDMQRWIHPALVKRVNGYLSYTPFFLSPELHAEVSGNETWNVTVPQNPCIGCWVGTWLSINAEGDVSPCVLLNDNIVCGNVRMKPLHDIIRESHVFNEILDRHRLKGKCGRCRYKLTCGGCRAIAFYHSGDYMAEDPTCFFEPEDETSVCEFESKTNSMFLKYLRVASRSGMYKVPVSQGGITVENYRPGDEVGINRLFNVVFDQQREIEEWAWKFTEGPVDSRPFIVLAKEGDKVVGHSASLVLNLKYHDSTVRAHNAVNYMIHPNCRGKGVSVQLYRKAREQWMKSEIDCTFAFPNKAGYLVVKKLYKYKEFIKVKTLSKRLSWRLACAKRLNSPFIVSVIAAVTRIVIGLTICLKSIDIFGKIRYGIVRELDKDKTNGFWNSVKDKYEIMLERDFSYLNWRYIKKPANNFSIIQAEDQGVMVGIAVTNVIKSFTEKKGQIMECLCKDEKITVQLLARCLLLLSRQQVDYVECRISSEDPLQEQLLELGFIDRIGEDKAYSLYQIYTPKVKDGDMQDASKWHVTCGDSDL